VPADGFLEWQPGAARVPRPYWFHRPDHGALRLAGLFAEPVAAARPARPASFTILTTTAGGDVAPIHDRMPVLLADDTAVDSWLHAREPADRLRSLLRPASAGTLVSRAVSPRVNTPANDDPGCLAAVEAVSQPTLL
ncbi:MAG: SOS response-associated peptidase family protein, partial [Dehalococcoidia bacterium]